MRGEAYITIVERDSRRIIHQGVPDVALSRRGNRRYINRATAEFAFSQTLRDLAAVLGFWAEDPDSEGTAGFKVDEFVCFESPPALAGLEAPLEAEWTTYDGGENHADGYHWGGPYRISVQVWVAGKRRISAVCLFTVLGFGINAQSLFR